MWQQAITSVVIPALAVAARAAQASSLAFQRSREERARGRRAAGFDAVFGALHDIQVSYVRSLENEEYGPEPGISV